MIKRYRRMSKKTGNTDKEYQWAITRVIQCKHYLYDLSYDIRPSLTTDPRRNCLVWRKATKRTRSAPIYSIYSGHNIEFFILDNKSWWKYCTARNSEIQREKCILMICFIWPTQSDGEIHYTTHHGSKLFFFCFFPQTFCSWLYYFLGWTTSCTCWSLSNGWN